MWLLLHATNFWYVVAKDSGLARKALTENLCGATLHKHYVNVCPHVLILVSWLQPCSSCRHSRLPCLPRISGTCNAGSTKGESHHRL